MITDKFNYIDIYNSEIWNESLNLRQIEFELYINALKLSFHRKFTDLFQDLKCYKLLSQSIYNKELKIFSDECFEKYTVNEDCFSDSHLMKGYVDAYSIFESFLSELHLGMMWFFPEIFDFGKEIKLTTSVIEMNKYSKMIDFRRVVLEKKVSEFIYESIDKQFKRFTAIYNIDLKISKNDIKDIVLISNIRNIITHNEGRVNSIFLDRLRVNGISQKEFKEGESIFDIVSENYFKHTYVLSRIVEKMFNGIDESSEKLFKYLDSKINYQ